MANNRLTFPKSILCIGVALMLLGVAMPYLLVWSGWDPHSNLIGLPVACVFWAGFWVAFGGVVNAVFVWLHRKQHSVDTHQKNQP